MLNVSVVVVCFNEKDNIEQCILSLLQQNYPREFYEILFIDNGSTDGTQDIIKKYKSEYLNIHLEINSDKGIAGSRNFGLLKSRYEYIAFTDADCIVPENWLQKLTDGYQQYHMSDPNVIGVGGSNNPPLNSSCFYDVLYLFLNTYLGSHGSVQGKRFDLDKAVTHIPTLNVFFHKPRILRMGGFDITFGNIGEDQDLSYRLQEHGYYYYYLKDAPVVHNMRPTFATWFKNMFVYGYGRTWLMLKHPSKIEPVLFLPMVLLLSVISAMLFFKTILFFFPLLIYLAVISILSVGECIKVKNIKYIAHLFVLYIGTHFSYGLGQWYGLFKKRELYRLESQQHLIANNR